MMKAVLAGLAMLVGANVVDAATFLGGDDFNDNSVDPSWSVYFADPEPALTETNQRLEYTSPGGETYIGWQWNGTALSATQDWSVVVDVSLLLATNTIVSANQSMDFQLRVTNSTNDFGLKFQVDQSGFGFRSQDSDNILDEVISDHFQATSASQATLRVSFDADTETMTTAYNSGAGFISLTNVNVSGWGLSGSMVFTPYIGSDNVNISVSAGEVYADNFSIYDGIDLMLVDGVGIHTAVEIDWPSTMGVAYQVQYTTDLASSNWTALGTPIIASGTTTSAFDSTQGTQQRFYRVVEQ